MKKYKRSVTMNFFFMMVWVSYCLIWLIIPFGIFNVGGENVISMLGLGIIISFVMILFYAVVCAAIELIASIFIKRHVLVEGDCITWFGKTIHADTVAKIVFDIGAIRKYRSTPATVFLMDLQGKGLLIERPSYFLLFKIKRICKNAKFEVYDLKKMLLLYPIFSLLLGIAICVIVPLLEK